MGGTRKSGSATTSGKAAAGKAPPATTEQTVNEFGVEQGQGEPSSGAGSSPATGSSGQNARVGAGSTLGSAFGSHGSPDKGQSVKTEGDSEFGM